MEKRLTIKIKQIKCIEENEATDDEIYMIGRSVEWEGNHKFEDSEKRTVFPSKNSTIDFDEDDPPFNAQNFVLIDHQFDNELRGNIALWEEDSGRMTMEQLDEFYDDLDDAIVDAFNDASSKAGMFSVFVDIGGAFGKPVIRTGLVFMKLAQKIWKIADPDDLIRDQDFHFTRDSADFEDDNYQWSCRGEGANYEVILSVKLETVN